MNELGVALPQPSTNACALAAAGSDSELTTELRAGSAVAFELLVRTHGPRMLAVACRMLGCEAEGADAVQDAFFSAFRRLDSFRGESQLSTWLHRIVMNACLMRLRTRKRRPEKRLEDLLPRFDDTGHHVAAIRPWESSPLEAVCQNETLAQVRRCIDSLPEPHRSILVLRDLEALDTASAAELLGVSESVVKTRLHRARQALRTLLEAHFGPKGER